MCWYGVCQNMTDRNKDWKYRSLGGEDSHLKLKLFANEDMLSTSVKLLN